MPPLVSVTMKECSNCKIQQAKQEGYEEGYNKCVEEVEEQMSQRYEQESRRSRHDSYQQMVIIN